MEENNKAPIRSSAVNKQEGQGWVYYKELGPIPDNLLGLNVCTLDFKVKPRYTIGELPEDRAFHELIRNTGLIKNDFIIDKNAITPFLSELEAATGGKGTFRHFSVQGNTIRQYKWNLKFLNIYLNPKNDGTFIVCDRFSRAIRYKELLNVDKDTLFWQDTTREK